MASPTATLDRPPAHIDPRIRARRIEVQRGMGRRRLHRLIDLGLLLAVAAGFAGALRSPLLDVEEIVVRGAEHTPADQVIERTGIVAGDQLMDLDLRAAGEELTTLPWVHSVLVHRGLDGRVVLDLTERTAVAVAGDGTAAVLVDREGRVLARADDEPELAAALVRIADVPDGLEPGGYLSARAADALGLAARLAAVPSGPMRFAAADSLVGTLVDSGIEIRFGGPGQLDAKVRSLRTVLDQVDLTCAAVIDVGSPGSPVLTREEACS